MAAVLGRPSAVGRRHPPAGYIELRSASSRLKAVAKMAAKDIPGKVGEAELRAYLKRILEDEQLRGNLASAYGAAKSAYGRVTNGKSSTWDLIDDRQPPA